MLVIKLKNASRSRIDGSGVLRSFPSTVRSGRFGLESLATASCRVSSCSAEGGSLLLREWDRRRVWEYDCEWRGGGGRDVMDS